MKLLKFSPINIMTLSMLSLYAQQTINLYNGPIPWRKKTAELEISEAGSDGITRASKVSKRQ